MLIGTNQYLAIINKINMRTILEVFLRIIIVNILIISSSVLSAQVNLEDKLMFGAEIIIEPGQTDENIESWFKTLSDNNMYLTRIRMFETYMKDENGNWDFSLYDRAFNYANKYNIKIYANLFPETDFTDVGGFKFPYDREHLVRIAKYKEAVVTHFVDFNSLYGWVPINEPGGGNINDPLAREMFAEWRENKTVSPKNSLTKTPHFSFDKYEFLLNYNTWYLRWLAEEIRKYDKVNPIHVNTHQIFENIAQYDFQSWSESLTSLGGSAHASWHFGYFSREKYALAMSANSEIILSGAGKIPWLMTELQGGNNIYSGNEPFCPTKEEIAQWLWISIATGSKGAIFWCLNPRMSGTEAGEWAMINFQNRPTDRLIEAGKIAKIVSDNEKLFSLAKPVNSKINILYNRESMWVENQMVPNIENNKYEVRDEGATIKSAISYFEALSELGLQPTFKEFNEFSFTDNDYKGQTIILSHQIALPEGYYNKLRHFVKNGGTLFVDGLTAFYDEYAKSKMMNNFPLADLFGGSVSEFIFEKDIFNLYAESSMLSSHALKGVIRVKSGEKIIVDGKETLGLINKYGTGKVVWIPSLIGLGACKTDSYEQLISFLKTYILTVDELRFESYQSGLLMKNLKSGDNLITVVINKDNVAREIELKGFSARYKNPSVMYSNKNSTINDKVITIDSEDTLIILWDDK